MSLHFGTPRQPSDLNSSIDEPSRQGGAKPSRIELTLDPPSKTEKSTIGESSHYIPQRPTGPDDHIKKWYVLRVRYNHDATAYDALSASGLHVFYANHHVVKLIHGKRRKVEAPLLPGLLFAHATKADIEDFMFGTSPMSLHVRFYRDRTRLRTDQGLNPPLTVDDHDMDSFIKICQSGSPYIQVIPDDKQGLIRKGDWVRVTGGDFKGVEGRTAIVKRQRCVLVDLKGVCCVTTAYIPKFLLEVVTGKDEVAYT